MASKYRATLSKSQEREGWSVIFRHPLKLDTTTGKPGRRVRRGLGTRDAATAESLIAEMNELLGDESYWSPAARALAMHRFSPKIVDIFYDDLLAPAADFRSVRDGVIELPSSATTAYRRVALVGTTGSGKTTLVRQLLGTDPKRERFPSTSTAKTTVAETELVITDGPPYQAVVTFLSRDTVVDYVQQCLSVAALSAHRGDADEQVLDHALNHVSQRFRLSYMLGNGRVRQGTDNELDDDGVDDEDFDDEADFTPNDIASHDGIPADEQIAVRSSTDALLNSIPLALRSIAERHSNAIRLELDAQGPEDERVLEELFEEDLDCRLAEDDDFQELIDQLLAHIELRFDWIGVGQFSRNKQGWPISWSWHCEDRAEFIRTILRFSSNHARYFGTLLTPIVNGIRVAGPFKPVWSEGVPRLVLFDGEGLGHTPESAVSIPTALTRRFDDVDAIVLVDNATQPMQAATIALLRSLAASGRGSKLITCFTHFDNVKGDNLPTFETKERHVLQSVENALTEISRMGLSAERTLRRQFDSAAFFVGGIHEQLNTDSKRGRRTISQLERFLDAVHQSVEQPVTVDTQPVYNSMKLSLMVKEGAEQFHRVWRARLGKIYDAEITKEHWTRVKALTRRLALMGEDEYDNLRPIADLHQMLQEPIRSFIENPSEWTAGKPEDQAQDQIFNRFANEISGRVMDLVRLRIWDNELQEWARAFEKRGRGSTFERASIIADSIFGSAAPIPTIAPSRDGDALLQEIAELVRDSADECSVALK